MKNELAEMTKVQTHSSENSAAVQLLLCPFSMLSGGRFRYSVHKSTSLSRRQNEGIIT
jgi:hypothetical protein